MALLTPVSEIVVAGAHVVIFPFLDDLEHKAAEGRRRVVEEWVKRRFRFHAVLPSVEASHGTENRNMLIELLQTDFKKP